MKILFTSIISTTLILFSVTANGQSTVALKDADELSPEIAALSINNLDIKQADKGFTVSWEAHNQFQIARFELQASDNNRDFNTVKRRTCPAAVNGKYEAMLSNTTFTGNPVYYRIKIVSLDGQEAFTASYPVQKDCDNIVIK